jgi:hypothetical protein
MICGERYRSVVSLPTVCVDNTATSATRGGHPPYRDTSSAHAKKSPGNRGPILRGVRSRDPPRPGERGRRPLRPPVSEYGPPPPLLPPLLPSLGGSCTRRPANSAARSCSSVVPPRPPPTPEPPPPGRGEGWFDPLRLPLPAWGVGSGGRPGRPPPRSSPYGLSRVIVRPRSARSPPGTSGSGRMRAPDEMLLSRATVGARGGRGTSPGLPLAPCPGDGGLAWKGDGCSHPRTASAWLAPRAFCARSESRTDSYCNAGTAPLRQHAAAAACLGILGGFWQSKYADATYAPAHASRECCTHPYTPSRSTHSERRTHSFGS